MPEPMNPQATPAPASPDTRATDVKTEAPKEPTATPPVNKYKIGDKEYDEPTLAKLIEKGNGADRTFQQSAAMRKEAERIVAALKSSPEAVLLNKALGHNPSQLIKNLVKSALQNGTPLNEIRETVAEMMYEWIQDEQMDPKERENRELKAKLDGIEKEKKAAEEAQKQEVIEKMTRDAYEKFNKDIVDALGNSGLPKTSYTVRRMAYWLDQAYKLKAEYAAKGVEVREPSAKDVLEYVKRDYETAIKELYGSADVETLVKLLGDDQLAKIRAYDVNRLKSQLPGAAVAKPVSAPKPSEASKPVRNSAKNFFKQREEEIRRMEREAGI